MGSFPFVKKDAVPLVAAQTGIQTPAALAGKRLLDRHARGFQRRAVLLDLRSDDALQVCGSLMPVGTTNVPVAASRACTAGVLIAVAVASCSFLMMAAGVPLGRKKANQVEAANGMPCSKVVGTFGSDGSR